MGTSSQKAELIALTRALHIAKGQQAKTYTDSKYAFLIAPDPFCPVEGKGFPYHQGPFSCQWSPYSQALGGPLTPSRGGHNSLQGRPNLHGSSGAG